MGLTGVTIFFAGSNLGLVYTSAADAALIQGAIPAVTTVLAVFVLRERVDRWRVGGIAVSLLGVGLIVLTGSPTASAPNPLLGNLLTFVAVFSWAIYTMLGKSLGGVSELVVTAYSVLFGTILLIPFAAYELRDQPTLAVSPTSWLVVLFLGAGASGVAFLLWNYALRVLDASLAASYINLIPLIGVATAAGFLGESLSPSQLLGGVLILAGIWLATRAADIVSFEST
jgi:drug/metabolite transporter (DMT)-like permease